MKTESETGERHEIVLHFHFSRCLLIQSTHTMELLCMYTTDNLNLYLLKVCLSAAKSNGNQLYCSCQRLDISLLKSTRIRH